MVGGLVKLIYPDGEFTKEELEEIIRFALEMRRRVKEQLKKLGGMEFYDVNFSYIDNDTFEEHYVSVPEQGGGKLIPEGICNPGQVYNVSRGKQECSVYSDLNLGYCQVTVSLRKQVLEVTVKQKKRSLLHTTSSKPMASLSAAQSTYPLRTISSTIRTCKVSV